MHRFSPDFGDFGATYALLSGVMAVAWACGPGQLVRGILTWLLAFRYDRCHALLGRFTRRESKLAAEADAHRTGESR